jgi:hypothetical protein
LAKLALASGNGSIQLDQAIDSYLTIKAENIIVAITLSPGQKNAEVPSASTLS